MKDFLFVTFIGLLSVQAARTQRKPPNYSLDAMPITDFDCQDKIVGGYYADPQTECQMFHVCTDISGVLQDFRFLCPNNTAFDQENQICDDWYNIDCEAATLFYSDNFDLFRIDAGRSNGIVSNKVTPIPLGPSSSSRPKVVKAKRPLGPVNNAVSDDEDDFFLQKSDTGDKRLHQDILRGSSSSNFFENKNGGREDYDNELHEQTGQRTKSNFIRPGEDLSKRKTKVAVRKLLTGKRPVTQQTTELSTETPPSTTLTYQQSTNYQNNYFQKTKYNILNRNRDSAIASTRVYDGSSTEAPSTAQIPSNRVYNNNYSQKQYFSKTTVKNAHGQSTVSPNLKSRGSVNYNTYLKSQTASDFVDIPKTSASPIYNTYQKNNFNTQTSQSPVPYNSPDITQAHFGSFNTPAPQNVNPQVLNNNFQQPQNAKSTYQQPQIPKNTHQLPQVSKNYQPTQVTLSVYQQSSAQNNKNQQPQIENNYQPLHEANFPQPPQVVGYQPSHQANNYQQPPQENNYQQPPQPTPQQNMNYQLNYNAPAQANNFFQKTTLNVPNSQSLPTAQNYQQQPSTNQFFQPTTPGPTSLAPQFNNYYQQYSTTAPNNVYQSSSAYKFTSSSTIEPLAYQKPNFYHSKKEYSSKAIAPGAYPFNPTDDKYEENNPDEFLKTAPSSNFRPSDLNALQGSYNKPSFNASVSASFKYSPNIISKSSSSNSFAASSTKEPPSVASSVSYSLPIRSSPKPFTLPITSTVSPQKLITNAPKANIPKASAPIVNQPNVQSPGGKDEYDYAYYDDGAVEYDGVEPIQEEFHKTKNIKKA